MTNLHRFRFGLVFLATTFLDGSDAFDSRVSAFISNGHFTIGNFTRRSSGCLLPFLVLDFRWFNGHVKC